MLGRAANSALAREPDLLWDRRLTFSLYPYCMPKWWSPLRICCTILPSYTIITPGTVQSELQRRKIYPCNPIALLSFELGGGREYTNTVDIPRPPRSRDHCGTATPCGDCVRISTTVFLCYVYRGTATYYRSIPILTGFDMIIAGSVLFVNIFL